ncbi:TIGR03862 family flavoprotein [Falsigemmobacter intermedius]|uniref:TIGR03862 family flavoprotein n=1 Tax=Falsigemmobacter intermedius TaxID=1553448 RepID=A0A3S3U400_9RHOB|nr:TIGR03862 family flavoprotein [Falsigemmobacter intermedius]RWY39147.1 TIGR03862 family flavoprotein [Falsigemmobacter intermedius]
MAAEAWVIGAGPAGLMAALELARAGHVVHIAESMPSPARKLLMAGKSGLNITKDEPLPAFLAHYGQAQDWLTPMLADFGPEAVKAWAEALGQAVYTGSSGRVFPVVHKASPLLRAWLAELEGLAVQLHRRWRWTGFDGAQLCFSTPEGDVAVTPSVVVLALGGASWSRLGSDGSWAPILAAEGVKLAPFAPSNAGLLVSWSAYMTRHFGAALKGLRLSAGGFSLRGEAVISARGLEGGGLYPLTPALREGAVLRLDLFPDLSLAALEARLERTRGDSAANRLRKAGLDAAKQALVMEVARPLPGGAAALAAVLKDLAVPHQGPRPMDEAISTAGGVTRDSVDEGLQLRARPGVFVAGEMLDWEAPTGGYLLTACLATGRHAGRAAAGYAAGPAG